MKSLRLWNGALAICVLAASACGEGDPVDLAPNLIGSYELASVTYPGQPTGTPPYVTGTLTLTESGYSLEINAISPEGPVQVIDQGTYQVDGTSWSQSSTGEQPSAVGTYEFDGVLLHLDVVAEEAPVQFTWRKLV